MPLSSLFQVVSVCSIVYLKSCFQYIVPLEASSSKVSLYKRVTTRHIVIHLINGQMMHKTEPGTNRQALSTIQEYID